MKIVKINVQDGLGQIEVALYGHEASRLTSFLNKASVALAAAPTPPVAMQLAVERFPAMRDSGMPLEERIETAIERIKSGYAAMRIPVEATDPDVVLQDCLIELTRLRSTPPAQEVEPVATRVHSYGGSTGINDYLMSDGSIKAMRPEDVTWTPPAPEVEPVAFQYRVQPWMMACFGEKISADKVERNHRFLEEALELVQACACSQDEAHQLVDYVYGRPVGMIHQEIGGVMVTLAALCLSHGLDMHKSGDVELARIWQKVEQIRAKQAAKPKHSPLPVASPNTPADNGLRKAAEALRILDLLGSGPTADNLRAELNKDKSC
ncbi:hypothetical protein SAMN05216428_102315 [Nitrosospira sp. Nsp11]|uniref:hypothetical protein n=1 Tax=Nitrosospira sp. Nsp11 TaxID=1855338 RepID=UPI00091EADE8|nr:hypothetical protein [Nitrosospira sp. Nsp11]SHL41033.1 hypothetical protein SAMN05216428_102315 [Nitrosospira sp. Nsp11]